MVILDGMDGSVRLDNVVAGEVESGVSLEDCDVVPGVFFGLPDEVADDFMMVKTLVFEPKAPSMDIVNQHGEYGTNAVDVDEMGDLEEFIEVL